ncbi:hypothetical protein ACIRPT_21375 [Streptomyces sp. NPDC101227]|uniref:hypothetical protein n=1 Tax=Streptomyces sp. NPDC101227 TaxID=3366136 RepID=UPI0037F4F4AD
MLNRTSPADLSRTLEAKAVRRPWNPALHPRDSKGRFIETGGIARLWSGKLARVVRALPRDRVLVQDRAGDGTYTGRRHSTSARWITMVARPDGTAPTSNQKKVEAEDARRVQDERRGLGLSRDDHGDPSTPDDPHDADDEGNAIGVDNGESPKDDDQEEPQDGHHDVDVDALPNRAANPGSRYKDTAAVRRHFLDLAQEPGANAPALRRLAGDEDLQIIPSGGLVTTRDDANGRWYLTTAGTGGYLDIGDFTTRAEAEAAGEYIHEHVRNGHIMPGEFNEPIDFSDRDIADWFLTWRSTKGEDAEQAIRRAVADFRNTWKDTSAPQAPAPKPSRAQPRGRFTTLQQVRTHWTERADSLRASGRDADRRTAGELDALAEDSRLKLVGDGQFVARRVEGDWYLYATGTGQQMPWWFDRQADAKGFAEHIVGTLKDKDGNALDFSSPEFAKNRKTWRSAKGRDYDQEWTAARALWDQDHPPKHSIATDRLAETLRRRPFGDEEQAPKPDTDAVKPTPEPKATGEPDAPDAAPEPVAQQEEVTPEPSPDERPKGVPEDADPVDGVEGYRFTNTDGSITLYGPDGQVAARSVYGSSPKATVNGVAFPLPRYGETAATLMARAHRAAHMPAGKRDKVTAEWITFKGKRVMVFRGTTKGDSRDYQAIGSVRAMKWAPSLNGYVTQSNMLPETRDDKITEVLGRLARQDRYVVIADADATARAEGRPDASPVAVDPDEEFRNKLQTLDDDGVTREEMARWGKQSRVRSESGRRRLRRELELIEEEKKRRREERDEANRRDPSTLSDQDIESLVKRSQEERGTYGRRKGEDANDVERAVYGERRRRSLAVANDPADLSTLTDDELNSARNKSSSRRRLHVAAGDDHAAEKDVRDALDARTKTVEFELGRRKAAEVSGSKPIADMSDKELEEQYRDLLLAPGRRESPPEVRRVLTDRMESIKEEQDRRQAAQITDRPDPAGMDSEDLVEEYQELEKGSSAREADAVVVARRERSAGIAAELDRRDSEGNEALIGRAEVTDGGSVSIDGGASYASISYTPYGGAYREAGWYFSRHGAVHSRSVEGLSSRAAALAAVVRAYDADDDRRGERTWGRLHRVFVPKMFYELYGSERGADRLSSASEERRFLYSLFAQRHYGWSDGSNPVTGKSVKGANLSVPEGLLAEFTRVTDELSRRIAERANNRDLDSSDRSKARNRLASINAALHAIEAVREQIRKDGGDDDRKVVSREEIEAQQAELRAALGGDDEHVQPEGAGALADVPAAGVGGDGGSAGVRGDEGPGDRDGDSGGGDGSGEDRGTGRGVPAAGGAAQAASGGRDGDGTGGSAAGAGDGGQSAAADAGDEGLAGDEGRDLRRVERFRPDPADLPKGPVERAAGNLDAIRALKRIEKEQRPPTQRELRALSRWTGWGSVPILFAPEPDQREPRYQQGGAREGKFEQDHQRWSRDYRDLRDALRRELTPVEWRQASRGTLSMHYTPQPIAEAMWDGLKAFGFDRGDVLEAGSGGGTFFGVAPDGARLTGVEIDPTTARIARAMYPDANVLNESFAETDVHPATFDVSIGNVPFAQAPFDDKRYPAESLHNGFITKELALTRPGGISILITSRHTLDSKNDKARRKMAEYGDLLGAVRLPSGVFNDTGTGVTTDVLVFRRRGEDEQPGDMSWLNAPERDINGSPHHVNTYFDQHPEHILGTLTTESSAYGPTVTVKGTPDTASGQLRMLLEEIAGKATADGRGYTPHPDGDDRPPVLLQAAREKHANDWSGRLYEGEDGRLYQHVNGGNPVVVEPSDGRTAQLRALMELRDVAAELRELDRKNDEDERAEKLRGQLRDLHAAYVDTYGPLSKPGQTRSRKTAVLDDGTEERTPTAWGYFRSDPDAASVLALEQWDAQTQQPVLSRVFTERAAARRQPLTATDDPKVALAAVVAATGRVDLGQISRLLNLDPQETLRRLGNEVFTDPATGRLELARTYLSGPVRDKLAAARRAAANDPSFAVNVSALEAVQPPERTIGEFTPEMGAHWTPPNLVQGFLRDYLGDRTLIVSHDDRYGWVLTTGQVPRANNVLHGVAADPAKGTKGRSAVEIARAILGSGSLTVYKDDKRKDVDERTTRLVRQKADQMRAAFAQYATADAERLTELTEFYNRIMNAHVVASYDGMSPSLEGLTPDRDPHPWQLSGAARMQFEPSVILAHEVGLGKTSTYVMGTQALKASGQVEKPFLVVQDYLAQQTLDEAHLLYPNADFQLITSADLADGRRGATLEWLRANKHDLVIFTEEAFGSIKMSPEQQDEYELRELTALQEQLERQYEGDSHPFIVAKIEQRIATVERNIRKNAAAMRKPGEIYWDDLGFDYAVIDEAHRFKGVGFRSKEGGGDAATIRGIDLHQKTEWMHRVRGHGRRATITLGTGTPLTRSIAEEFTMLSFAAPWILHAYNAGAPDLWANTFGRKVLRIENAPDGSGLRVVERFAEFHNKRSMKTMWGLVADTRRADDVGIPRPKIAGGKVNLVLVDATKDQKERLKKLVARGRAIHNGDVTRDEDNMLAVANEGTSVAIDPRLVDANAPAGNKLRAVAEKHIERYHRFKDRVYKTHYGSDEDHPVPGALQLIFLNEGVPGGKNKGNFSAYAELRDLMVAGGIPADKIAFVQDHKDGKKPAKAAELFRRARNGEIAVLIGSTATAGTGMNAQNRMVSVTHVDLDWGAADMEQRNGRGLRYGNQNAEVEIDIFATKGSLDGWKAGFVATKAEGLIDIQRPETADGDTSDTVIDIDLDYPDYETMEAEIGGNPYMSQLVKVRRQLRDLETDQHNEAAERIRRADAIAALTQESEDLRTGIARREQALPRIRDVRGTFAMTLNGMPYSERGDAAAALHRQVTQRLLEHAQEGITGWHVVGQYGGLDVGVRTERTPSGKLLAHVGFPDLARSEFTRSPQDLKNKNAGSGVITRLANALDKAPALQEADREKLPAVDTQIALLQSAHASADYTPQIEHTRARSHLLDDIVGNIAELDALPEIEDSELDKHLAKPVRRRLISERRAKRAPLQARVEEAVARLEAFDRDNPEPERTELPEGVRLSADDVTGTLNNIRPVDPPASPDGEDTDEAGTSGTAEPAPQGGDLIGGRFQFQEPVTDPDGQGWRVFTDGPDGRVFVTRDGRTEKFQTDELTSERRDRANSPETQPESGATAEDDTVSLDQDEVAQQLDAIRPNSAKAPSAMTDQEIADEIVALMEREMADGELIGADRTRMAVLEAEKDRRAGRTPKPEPKKPEPAEPAGGLFDVDEPEAPASQVADPNNPLDQPDDEFGTPDMFADHEGRDTSRLRPVQMRNPADLTEGDRYTDADGLTHTVTEPPKLTGRGRVRIVTSDGEDRFYKRDAELRLRHPDEEITDDGRDEQSAPDLNDGNTPEDSAADDDSPAAPQDEDATHNDEAPEPEQQDEDDTQQQDTDEEQRDDEQHRRDRGARPDSAAPDETPEGAGGGPQMPDTTDSGREEGNTDAADKPNVQNDEHDRDQRRGRRRRGNRGGGEGPGTPGGPGLPRLDLPHLPRIPAGTGGRDDADRNGGTPDREPGRTVAELRDTWRRGDRLTADENTPERRAFLAQLADNPTLTLSSGGGLITWTDDFTDSPDGRREWRFAQARNGGRLGKVSVTARNADEARELADRFEDITDGHRMPIDWHQPLTPDAIARWRDAEGRPLPEALRAVRDAFQQERERDGANSPTQPEPASIPDEPQPAALPEDLTGLSDEDLATAWGTGLSESDQMRVMEEMDRRDDADKRVRDAIPATPAADAEEVRRRGEAMDAALRFGTADVTRRPQTREERLQREFQDLDEARYSAAIDATNGYFFSSASRRLPPVSERDLFSGGTLSRFGRWRDYASEELIEWFDNNGGRLTYNQFKQKRRTDEKIEREQYDEAQRQAAGTPAVPEPDDAAAPEASGLTPAAPAYAPAKRRFADLKAVREHIRSGQLDASAPGAGMHTTPPAPEERREIADDKNTRLSRGGRLLVYGNRAARERKEYNRRYIVAAPGSLLPVLKDHSDGFSTLKEALHAANTLEDVRDADGQTFPWDAPDAVDRARAFRGPDGESLAETMAHVLAENPSREGQWKFDRARAEERQAWRQTADDWHRQQEADGYTILADPSELQADDEVSFPLAADPDRSLRSGAKPLGTARGTITSDQSEIWNPTGIQALGSRDYYRYPADLTWTAPDGRTDRPHDARLVLGVVRRKPRLGEENASGVDQHARRGAQLEGTIPDEPSRPDQLALARAVAEPEPSDEDAAEPEPRPEPEPIGGQPAHWASVDQLQSGDMARLDGTTRRGRTVTRAGYVLDSPERVTVTRRGRTEEMWRTTIGESPDGRTGSRGAVYTPLNATAARAKAPDTAAPGAPTSGAQGDVISGDLPDTIATDTRGRGLFPGSHVTGNGDREGTVTGVTDTTVSVRWADGDTDNGVAPTSLTVDDTDDRRPAGWTSTGQRIRPGHVVSDENGALLGPVDEANGDRITVTTAGGTVTRDATDLRVVGEVRDDTPESAPITGISEPAANEINKGDIVVLDLDGALTTVEVLDTNREGDRVTLDYVDTTTGEFGAIDMDATAVVHKAEGPNGATPDLGSDDAPAAADDLTVHEPLPALDPITGPTVDPDLTPADRDAIADNGSSPEDDPDAQQAAARLGADLPVTPDQAAALASQLRANSDPATTEGRAALRAADHLDHAAGRTAPEGLDRPRPSNAAQIGEGDVIAMPDERRGDEVHVYRVIDVEEGPGGVRSLLLEDENRQWKRRIVHAAMPMWQLPEPAPATNSSNDAPDPVPATAPRSPNPQIASVRRQTVADHSRTVAMRIIDEAVAGTEPPGDIHALREQIAQRLTPEALQDARNAARQHANAALDAAGITGRDRAAVQQALRRARGKAHERTVRAALRTINDLEPLPGEPDEDLAQRAADLLRLIPDQADAPSPSQRRNVPDSDASSDDATTHVDDAVTALLRQLEEAGADPADIDELTRLLTTQLDRTRQATARRIVRRAAATAPDTAQQPGLLAHVIAILRRIGRRLIELVKAAAEKIAELWRNSRDRLSRLKAFLRRLVRRVRDWPESRRLARLHAALDLPDIEGESLAARVSQWAGLLPERGRFGQAPRHVSWWRPTTWAQLAAGRLPGRSSESRWIPDRASDGGPGLAALRHMAALRAAGTDVDQDVTRRLADALGEDFSGDPHGTLRHADDYVAATERRLLNLHAARSSTIQAPDVDVEIAAARMEAAAARREWEELRTRYAAAVPDAVAAALADVRDLGPQGNAGLVFGPDTNPDAERAVRDVQRLIPRDWLATPDGRRLTAVDGEAGRYEPDVRRATVADLGDEGVGTAAHALAQHLAGHLPDLDAAQRAFWFTRTHTGRPGARTLDRTALGRILAQQQTQTDTGDSLARSMQAMFNGDWYEDDDLRAFLLGLLATR